MLWCTGKDDKQKRRKNGKKDAKAFSCQQYLGYGWTWTSARLPPKAKQSPTHKTRRIYKRLAVISKPFVLLSRYFVRYYCNERQLLTNYKNYPLH